MYTYDSLFDEVVYTLDRSGDDDFEANLPNYIQQAQTRIARDKNFLGFQVVLVGNFTQGDPVVAKPAGWRKTVSMNWGSGDDEDITNPLYERTYEYCRAYWPDRSAYDSAYPPEYYADYDFNHWLIAPTPFDTNPFECIIMMTPQDLTDNNQTNWLTQYAPDLLKWATLLEAAPTLKNDSRIQVWKLYYDEAVGKQASESMKGLVDRIQLVQSP